MLGYIKLQLQEVEERKSKLIAFIQRNFFKKGLCGEERPLLMSPFMVTDIYGIAYLSEAGDDFSDELVVYSKQGGLINPTYEVLLEIEAYLVEYLISNGYNRLFGMTKDHTVQHLSQFRLTPEKFIILLSENNELEESCLLDYEFSKFSSDGF